MDTRFREEVAPLVGEVASELSRGQVRSLQGETDDLLAYLLRICRPPSVS